MSASSSATQVTYIEETVRGTTPGTGNDQELRVTGESLNLTVESASSEEIRSDRMVSDSVLTGGEVGGALNFEMSHKTYDDFLEALMAGVYYDLDAAASDGYITTADAVFTGSSTITSATNALPDQMVVGQWFQIAGSVSNDGIYRCSSTVAPTDASITVDTAVKDTVVESSVSVTVSSTRLKNGVEDLRTFSVEKQFTDVVQFFTFRGCGVASASFDFQTGSILTGSFEFLGQDSVRDVTTAMPGSTVAATTTPVMNSVTGTTVLLDGADLGTSCAESFTLNIGTGMRGIRCLGSGLGFADVAVGTFEIMADLSIFFGSANSAAVYDKMLAGTPITMEIAVSDSEGNGMAFILRRAKITSCEIVAGGINQDIVMAMSITATIDTTTDAMLVMDRLGSVA